MDIKKFELLPASPDKCQECAVDHRPDEPHNKDSLFYQVKFHMKHGRYPKWADAISHCTPEVQAIWKEELQLRGCWEKGEKGVKDETM